MVSLRLRQKVTLKIAACPLGTPAQSSRIWATVPVRRSSNLARSTTGKTL